MPRGCFNSMPKQSLGHLDPSNFLKKGTKYAMFDMNDPYLLDCNSIKCDDQHLINEKPMVIQNMDQTQKQLKYSAI